MFTLTRETSATPEALWGRVAALDRHADTVPLTTTLADPGPPGPGWRFAVRTRLGPLRFDDPMVVEEWDPPRSWRVRKLGPLGGWATARVEPYAGGARLTWTEELWLRGPRQREIPVVGWLTRVVGDLVGPLVFGPVADRLVDPRLDDDPGADAGAGS